MSFNDELKAEEFKDEGWVKAHRVALIIGFVVGLIVGHFA